MMVQLLRLSVVLHVVKNLPFVRSLPGNWKFFMASKPSSAPPEFYDSSYEDSSWDTIPDTPAGDVINTLKGTSEGKFDFKAPKSGMYKFCFHNPHSTSESVSFYIHVGHIPSEHDLAKDEHLEPINVKIAKLREAMESITAEQMYIKAREARHRHTKESTRRPLYFIPWENILCWLL